MTHRSQPTGFRYRFSEHSEHGAALVEMAILLPILVMLVFGLVTAARAYNAQITLTHATREGVRVLAVTGDQVQAEAATVSAATSLDPIDLSVSAAVCVPGDPTSVSATYPFDYSIPFVGSQTITLTSTAVMRCGG
jgi:Flp pilus assembly protein TadG